VGLPEDRQSIFASGLAIVLALFDALNIEQMTVSERGLREGILERCYLAARAD
jgi:exopolyphosphatase/guanosine-5'-triphosphate,3'-diphosphate pyrophosphatase